MSLSDRMLDSGAARHAEVAHGERITVLSGPSAGLAFTAIRETEADVIFNADLGEDRRAKRMLRFRNSGARPTLESQNQIATADGKKWKAVRAPFDSYLTTDYELTEIVAGLDT